MSASAAARRPVEGATLDEVRDAIVTMYFTTDNAARREADDWLREVCLEVADNNASPVYSRTTAPVPSSLPVNTPAVPENTGGVANGGLVPHVRCVRWDDSSQDVVE